MYSELYRYFIQHKNLQLPGIGNFVLERKPAEADFVNRCIHPPVYSVSLDHESPKPGAKFFAWLGAALNISERDAVIRFNDFVFDLKKEISNGTKVEWNGIGTLTKGLGGEIKFQPGSSTSFSLKAIPAEKIIREKAEHTVLVGEREKTSAEMTEYFSQPAGKKNLWWVLPLSIILLSLMFISWYLSEHGLKTTSVSNTQKVQTTSAGEGYKELK